MPISSIKIRNFKRFNDYNLNLEKPITVILGENSSGKSSLLKAVLGLKQTSSPSNEHECWAAHGDYVDLGTYQDYVNNKDTKKDFSFTVSFDKNMGNRTVGYSRITKNSPGLSLYINYDYDPVSSQARFLRIKATFGLPSQDLSWELIRQKTRRNYTIAISEELIASFDEAYRFPDEESLANRKKFSISHVEKFTFKPALSGAHIAQTMFTRFVNETINVLSQYLEKNIFYLGPLRSSPSRSYIRSSHNLAVGVRGEHTPSVLANLERRSQKVTKGKSDLVDSYDLFSRGLADVFPGHVARTRIIEELVKLNVSNRETSHYASPDKADTITDVGFGFSQVFPILVQAAVMPRGSTLIIEQPELHLHPMAQTRLAKFIAEAAIQGKRFLIETHSEHLIRGFQLAISEGRNKKKSFSNDHVSFNYIKRGRENEPTLETNEFGEFVTEWPSGFFDESYRSTRILLRNKLR
ncbi:putative ATPase [Xanthomonas arboricola]|uniref:AAA family ATPase n=1 Tax=Xanthomonas cannabis TaxID=1885674 RepID=UPI00161093D1|nr:AAA family ATPase [Xanthomonas cannabis]MBB3804823.1 putative ATPase [Xanthomonas cannabis]